MVLTYPLLELSTPGAGFLYQLIISQLAAFNKINKMLIAEELFHFFKVPGVVGIRAGEFDHVVFDHLLGSPFYDSVVNTVQRIEV